MEFYRFEAKERSLWEHPCHLGAKRVLWSDSMLREIPRDMLADDVCVWIASGMSLADTCNILFSGATSPR